MKGVGLVWVAGVDGCKAGWIAAFSRLDDPADPVVAVFPRFADILASRFAPAMVAVDMPIGLPDRIEGGGRGPEQAARAVLGARRSAVFSIPSRAAVYAVDRPVAGMAAIALAHAASCEVARATSDGGAAFSRQAFMILPKIREIDTLLRGDPALPARIREVHPEIAFWSMNGERPLRFAKKDPEGAAERRALLQRHGLSQAALTAKPPKGAGHDDLLDAFAGLVVARHMLAGRGRTFPDAPVSDRHGLEIAIWSLQPEALPQEPR